MENIIIRIYRREKNPAEFAGIVELVEINEQRSFAGFDELREILDAHDPPIRVGSINCDVKRKTRTGPMVDE
jgi:hypothetical protein